MDKTIEKILALIGEILGAEPDEFSEHSGLAPADGIEPIDLAKLIIECEHKFRVRIHDEDVHELTNIGKLAEYIHKLHDE